MLSPTSVFAVAVSIRLTNFALRASLASTDVHGIIFRLSGFAGSPVFVAAFATGYKACRGALAKLMRLQESQKGML